MEDHKFNIGDSVRFPKGGTVAKLFNLVRDQEGKLCYYFVINPDDKTPTDYFPESEIPAGHNRLAMVIPVEVADRPGGAELIPR